MYWFVHIQLVCGQLLSVSYLDPELTRPSCQYSWVDLSRTEIRRFGYSRAENKQLRPVSSPAEQNQSLEQNSSPPEQGSFSPEQGSAPPEQESSLEQDQSAASISERYSRVEQLVKSKSWSLLTEDISSGSDTAVVDLIKPGQFNLSD